MMGQDHDIWFNHSDRIDAILCHATAVAYDNKALLLLGPSGSGKSTIALEMMAYGARLISDDRVWVTKTPKGALCVHAPTQITGMIEARHIGILSTPYQETALLACAVDLSSPVQTRGHDHNTTYVLDMPVDVIQAKELEKAAIYLYSYLKYGLIKS